MKCIFRFTRVALLALFAFFSSSAFSQATQSTSLVVQTTVASACLIAAVPLSFGIYSGTQVDSTTTVTVTCTNGSPAKILLGQGTNPASGSTDAAPVRQMADSGSHYLSYQLYSTSAGGTIWDNVNGKSTTGTGLADAHTVYGRLFGAQLGAPAGAYTDTVTATVSF